MLLASSAKAVSLVTHRHHRSIRLRQLLYFLLRIRAALRRRALGWLLERGISRRVGGQVVELSRGHVPELKAQSSKLNTFSKTWLTKTNFHPYIDVSIYERVLHDIQQDDFQREQEQADLAYQTKLSRWKESFSRHDPANKEYHRKLPHLIEGFLPLTYTVLLASDSKEGKTALLDAISLAIVKGEDFAGRKTQKGAVLWCSFEENPKQREINLTLDEHYNNHDLDIYTAFNMPPLHHEDACEMLQYLCLTWKIKLVVIDPLAGATGFHSLSEGHYIRRIMHTLNDIAYMCDCTIVIAHQASSIGNFRIADSIQIQASAGMIIYYDRQKLADGSHLVTINSKGRGPFANQTHKFRSTNPITYEPYIGEAEGAPKLRNAKEEAVLSAIRHGHETSAAIIAATLLKTSAGRQTLARLVKEGAVLRHGSQGETCHYSLGQPT